MDGRAVKWLSSHFVRDVNKRAPQCSSGLGLGRSIGKRENHNTFWKAHLRHVRLCFVYKAWFPSSLLKHGCNVSRKHLGFEIGELFRLRRLFQNIF